MRRIVQDFFRLVVSQRQKQSAVRQRHSRPDMVRGLPQYLQVLGRKPHIDLQRSLRAIHGVIANANSRRYEFQMGKDQLSLIISVPLATVCDAHHGFVALHDLSNTSKMRLRR